MRTHSTSASPHRTPPPQGAHLIGSTAQSAPVRLIGTSPQMCALRTRIHQYALTEATVLIQGETGSGKELAARTLHEASSRAARPLFALNCATLAEKLIQAELFGAVEGAFTGARARPGLFTEAHGATLFLDEVAELSAEAQAALLRVLETGQVRPVGSSRAHTVDVRVLSATHKDLREAVRQGRFRADLYHRLSVLRIDLPPLRAHLADLQHIAERLNPATATRLSEGAWRALLCHSWPGNVRELRNVLLRAQIEHSHGPLCAAHLRFDEGLGEPPPSAPPQAATLHSAQGDAAPLLAHTSLTVYAALVRSGGNISHTARALGCSRSTVYRHLARLSERPLSGQSAPHFTHSGYRQHA